MVLVMALVAFPAFAGGAKESAATEKVIRIADNVPGLITPGVWDGQTISMNSSIYEYLFEMHALTGEIEPVLATEWSTSDGREWIFTLRRGVTFHDGSSFDSSDVKYSIERTQDPKLGHLKKQDFEIVDSI